MERGFQKSPLARLGLGATALFYFFLFLFPVGALLLVGAKAPLALNLPDGYVLSVIRFTYTQALLSTVLSAVLGLSAAFLLYETTSAWPPKVARFSLLCFSLPSLLVVLGLLGVWGRSGWWNQTLGGFLNVDFYGLPAVAIANAFFNFPLFLLSAGLGLRGLDRRLEFCALGFGASRWQTFWALTFPRLWPQLRAPVGLCFLYSASTSFVIALFLGGGPQSTTLEVGIYQAYKMSSDAGTGTRLAAISILFSSLLFLGLGRLNWKGEGQEWLGGAVAPLYRFRLPLHRWLFASTVVVVFTALVLAPLVNLVSEGIVALGGLDLADVAMAMGASVRLAAMVVLVTLPLAVSFAWYEKHARSKKVAALLNWLPSLPLAVSSLVMAVALLAEYPFVFGTLRRQLWPVALVQSFAALPVAHRLIREALFRVPDTLYVTARSFGAADLAIFRRVELPLLRPALVTAALIAVGISLGEVASVLLFSPGEISTLSVEVFRSLQRYRFHDGYAFALILLGLLSAVLGFSTRSAK